MNPWEINNKRFLDFNGKMFIFAEEPVIPPTPSSCSDEDPEMLITVTGGTGTITWCGESWTEGQRGETRTICPTHYLKGKTTDLTNTEYYWKQALHRWYHRPGAVLSLILRRSYNVYQERPPSTTFTGTFGHGAISGGSSHMFENAVTFEDLIRRRDRTRFYGSKPTLPAAFNTDTSYKDSQIGIMTVGQPYYTDYDISDDMFGSYLTGGVTYTWARGNGWD